MRTSNDADYLWHGSQQENRKALDALIRGDCAESIYVQPEFAARHSARSLAAMRRPSIIH